MSQRFYTNVQMVGNQMLVRGYENGRTFINRENFQPTLYVPSKKKSKYKTLSGDFVEPINPGSIKDCREFIKKYENLEGFEIFGQERFIYQYISDMYPEDHVEFDMKKINE